MNHSIRTAQFLCAISFCFTFPVAHGADGTFSSNATGPAWLTAGNWVSSIIPGSSSVTGNTDLATFGANPTGGSNVGINMNTTSGNYYLGAIDVTSSRASTSAFTVSNNSATPGTLTLNGRTIAGFDNVILSNNGASLVQINNGASAAMNLALGNATENVILTLGTSNISIGSNITGASRDLTFTGGGSGTLTLAGANTYTGITSIGETTQAKTMIVTGGSTATSQFQLNNASSVLRFSISSGVFVYDNTFSGTGTVEKNGVATLALGGNNSGFNGSFLHQVGILRLDSANALGTANLNIVRSGTGTLLGLNSGNFTRALGTGADQFQVTGSGSSTFGFVAYGGDRTVNIGGAGANVNYTDLQNRLILNDSTATGTLTFANGLVLSSDRFLRVGNGAAAVDAVLAGNLTGSGSLTISGGGTLRMDGTNSYTGAIIVSEGTLLLSASGSTSASSAVTIADDATLGGTGTAAGTVTINGTLAPGLSIGTINTGNLTLGATSTLDIELGRAGITPVSDRANVTGTVSITSGADLKLTLYSGLNAPVANDIFFLISNDGADAITGVFTSLNGVVTTLNEGSTFDWNSQQWIITYQANFGSLSFTGGNDLAIMLMVIPEPSTWALLGVGAFVALAARRRRAWRANYSQHRD